MAKIIKLTDEYINQAVEGFRKALQKTKIANGKLSYTEEFESEDIEAGIYFTPLAWMKMNALVGTFDKEVAWHGVAERVGSHDNYEFRITDILIYPQEITATTVEASEEYSDWLMGLEDSVFNNLRMQGHSHVNMSVNPSGTDIEDQKGILDQLSDDMFYIFLIVNKKGDINAKIYDLKNNLMFEDKDICIDVENDEDRTYEFWEEMKSMVKSKTYGTKKSTNTTMAKSGTNKYPFEEEFEEDYDSVLGYDPYGRNYPTKSTTYKGGYYRR